MTAIYKKVTLWVCRTGQKEQFYTLYKEGVHGQVGYGVYPYCNFIKNLSHNSKDAQQKAEDYAKCLSDSFGYDVTIYTHESPRPIYLSHQAFGIEMKMSKSRKVWYGEANSTFWDEWKKNKQDIKKAGYWVKKDGYKWMLFKLVGEFTEENYHQEEEDSE